MRYTNWDVLIFAEAGDTKTPLQEFRTICEVVQDAHADKLPPSLHPSYFSAVTRPVPIVSCYIPSLAIGCPFRASVHSWDTPIATPATASMAHNESMAAFEAKVLVDGTYVAYDMTFLGPWCTMRWLMDDDSGAVFDRGDEWPQSILDKKGKPNQLRFPPFHTEMLDQTWVNPTQDLGRIKVIIAEGIRPSPASGFEKIRNVVIFSFQHVPLPILEDTGIAWPNHGMWYQAAPQFENVLSPRKAKEIDPDSHAHSPRRQHGRDQSRMTLSSDTQKLHGTNLAHAAPMRQVGNTSSRMALQQPPHMPDPFVGDGKPVDRRSSLFSKGHESSRRSDPRSADVVMTDRMILPYSDCDQSMPDCSRPLSPTSLRSVQMADFSRPPSFTNARIHTIPDSNRSPSLCDGARSRQMSGWEQALSGLGPLSVAAVQEAKGKPLENTSDEVGEGRAPLVEYARDNGDGFFEEGLSTCTPDRAKVDGTLAPVNTRVSSAITTPSTETRASSTREARYSSYSGKARVVSHTTRDPPTFAARSALGSSTKERSTSHKSPFGTLEEKDIENPKAQSVFNKMPASDVKGRKEGRTSEINLEVPCDDDHKACSASHSGHNKENHDASGMANTPRGDNKRRRISSVLEPDVVASNFSKDESKENSPMKHNDIDDLTAEGIITRTPLDQLDENIL